MPKIYYVAVRGMSGQFAGKKRFSGDLPISKTTGDRQQADEWRRDGILGGYFPDRCYIAEALITSIEYVWQSTEELAIMSFLGKGGTPMHQDAPIPALTHDKYGIMGDAQPAPLTLWERVFGRFTRKKK